MVAAIAASSNAGVRVLSSIARKVLKPVSAAADMVRKPGRGVTVLIYHRVGAGSGGEVDLDAHVFDEQMALLAQSGRAVTLDDAVALLGSGEIPERDPVVVTFDDGTPDVVDTAVPILVRHEIPMTLYLATDFVENGRPFWRETDPTLTWAAVAEAMSTNLVTVGSHTHTHALLDRLNPVDIADELDRSVDLIGERLGVQARHFAYPKALPPSAPARDAVAERFVSAALAGTRPNPYGSTNVMALSRSPIQRSDELRWFRRKLDGGMGFEDRVRDVINSRRYANATS
jgi:peptidoglycan/xylan/chitin deacetylase (PgdA/CDA1 family)